MINLAQRNPGLAARLTNSGKYAPRLAIKLTTLQGKVFRRTNGRVWKKWMGAPIIVMEVVGRKSGELRATPLIHTRRGDTFLVTPGNGGQPKLPAWWHNVKAAGEATVIADGERRRCRFRVADGAEREELWPLIEQTWPPIRDYQRFTDRPFPLGILEPL